ncbi:MAG: glutamate 5-kinase [Gammaproteobacteria bacterium]|nr:glutamate 5-kinase [Gammaproteobacteria bacterium]
MEKEQRLTSARRWVVKVGSSLLTNHGRGLNRELISSWVEQIHSLTEQGIEVVLVSSGAVSEGVLRLGWNRRPTALHELQAAAAVGQMGLIRLYEDKFSRFDTHTAQILLTHDDLVNRQRYLNARSTLKTLLRLGVVPIVNENDTVAVEEIRLGDNDTLAALVANLIEADLLVLLTDQPGMYDKDPRNNSDAVRIDLAKAGDPELERMASGGSAGDWGRGGMLTKVRAAQRAARSGTATLIAAGAEPDILLKVRSGNADGTMILPSQAPLLARKRWLAGQLQVRGRLVVDDGAVKALRDSGKSLLPVGVREVHGEFLRGDLVSCQDVSGREVARGLVNYPADEARQIVGQPSQGIEACLGYIDEPEMIHRDNLVVI